MPETMQPVLTINQKRVLCALEKAARPMGAYALLEQLSSEGFRAPVQVYRALNRLTEYGLVHRLETLNAYICCTGQQRRANEVTAYAICQCCGHTEEVDATELNDSIRGRMKSRAFSISRTTIEIFGRCAGCVDTEPTIPHAG
ncbi:MAG: transcriptional repressor [Pseudomonadota bacterium]|nr:transcriptional repressor [Pseudomonadota bacterium]